MAWHGRPHACSWWLGWWVAMVVGVGGTLAERLTVGRWGGLPGRRQWVAGGVAMGWLCERSTPALILPLLPHLAPPRVGRFRPLPHCPTWGIYLRYIYPQWGGRWGAPLPHFAEPMNQQVGQWRKCGNGGRAARQEGNEKPAGTNAGGLVETDRMGGALLV